MNNLRWNESGDFDGIQTLEEASNPDTGKTYRVSDFSNPNASADFAAVGISTSSRSVSIHLRSDFATCDDLVKRWIANGKSSMMLWKVVKL